MNFSVFLWIFLMIPLLSKCAPTLKETIDSISDSVTNIEKRLTKIENMESKVDQLQTTLDQLLDRSFSQEYILETLRTQCAPAAPVIQKDDPMLEDSSPERGMEPSKSEIISEDNADAIDFLDGYFKKVIKSLSSNKILLQEQKEYLNKTLNIAEQGFLKVLKQIQSVRRGSAEPDGNFEELRSQLTGIENKLETDIIRQLQTMVEARTSESSGTDWTNVLDKLDRISGKLGSSDQILNKLDQVNGRLATCVPRG